VELHPDPTLAKNDLQPAFNRDGFVALPRFVRGDALRELLAQVKYFLQVKVPGIPREHVFYEDKNDPTSLKQIQHLETYDPWFHSLVHESPFRKVAEIVLDDAVTPRNLQYFNKPPVIGQPTPPHQDGYYFMIDPCQAVTLWLALDSADSENGCVHYVRGSHQRGLREHARTQTLGFSQGIIDFPNRVDGDHEIAIPAEPGDLLIHDALTIHRADGNQSATRSRQALGLIYYSQQAREDTRAHDAYQFRLAEELKNQGKL